MENLNFKKIRVYNNVLNSLEILKMRDDILSMPMLWNGNDNPGDPINTLSKVFEPDDKIFLALQKKLFKIEPRLEHHAFERAGINVMMPQTNPPYFHTDGSKTISCVFYINRKTDIQDGGETQFDFDDFIFGVKPAPGKLIIFDGNIPHRATYFRNETRIIIYLKYTKHPDYNLFE